jgi:hypothetical protein
MSKAIKLDSACGLFADEHAILQKHAKPFEDIRFYLGELDPGCDVTIGAGGCGGCVNEDCDYAAFYIAQTNHIADGFHLNFDTGAHRDDRDPALSRQELGEVICAVAEMHGIEWSWDGDAQTPVYFGDDERHDTDYEVPEGVLDAG